MALNSVTSSKPAQTMASTSNSSTATAESSDTSATPAAPVVELKLQRSELLAFGAILPHESAGLTLYGATSPTHLLNLRTGRNWSAWQWQQVIRDAYETMTGPST
jgi:hypothetical protein